MDNIYGTEYVTIIEKNLSLPQSLFSLLMKKIEEARSLLPPQTQIDVCIDLSGDHLYHLRGDVSANGRGLLVFHSQHNDPVAATDALVSSINNAFCEKVSS